MSIYLKQNIYVFLESFMKIVALGWIRGIGSGGMTGWGNILPLKISTVLKIGFNNISAFIHTT